MRLWISPNLEKIEICDGDSHSLTIVEDPERYGLDPTAVSDYMKIVNDEDSDCEFDFDTIITLAEMAGWVRTSHDSNRGNGEIGISASDARRARKAIRNLIEEGHCFEGGVVLAIERIEGMSSVCEYRTLDSEAVDLFVHSGRLPMAQRSAVGIDSGSHDLIRSVTEARRGATTAFRHA